MSQVLFNDERFWQKLEGDLPEKWKIEPLKFHVKINQKELPNNTNSTTEIEYIDINSVHEGGIIDEPEKMKFFEAPSRARRIVTKNDSILSTVRTYLKAIAFIDKLHGGKICSTGFAVISPKQEFDPKFLYYFLSSERFVETITANSFGVAYPAINPPKLGRLACILAPIEKQTSISQFLDFHVKKLNYNIKIYQKLIELLKEKRQEQIDQVVTKGLDPSKPMKGSGIEWIGNIPEHWKMNKIKFSSYVKGRIGWKGLRSDEFTEEGPFLITGTEFENGKINWENCYHVEFWRYEQDPYIQIRKDDVLITKDGTIGKVALIDKVPGPTTLNSGVMVVRPLQSIYLPRYLFWMLHSRQFTEYVEYIKTGSTIKHLYQETFKNLVFAYPKSLDEQEQICNFLDSETRKINLEIIHHQKLVKHLKEKRQSLITSTVTGKIDVECA